MPLYTLSLTADSDVSPAAARERGFATPSYPFLPGSAIRGALAARWISLNGRPETQPARFAAEVLTLRVGPGIAQGCAQRPLSVHSCKYPRTEACRRTFDAAFGELPADGRCPGCGMPLEASKGQWEGGLRRRSRSRTALTELGTAAEGQLFSRQSLAAGQVFQARAKGELSWCLGQDFPLRVGGQRSTGGRVTTRIVRVAPQTGYATSERTLVVRLVGPAVFLADDARTMLQPQAGDLRRALRGSVLESVAESVEVTGAWVRPETTGGWNAAAGLPKATEVVAAPASTYALTAPAGHAWDPKSIAAVRDAGLGVRRTDGLGWVEVADSPWRPAPPMTPQLGRAPVDPAVQAVADAIDALRDRSFRRQVSGWLSDGYAGGANTPPGYAFDGLSAGARSVAEDALGLHGDQRRALIVTLTARDHRDRNDWGHRR